MADGMLTSRKLPRRLQPGASPPFHELGEYIFQNFCRDLLGLEPSIGTCTAYGVRGQKQFGIDLIATRTDGDGVEVGQCKCHEDYDAAKIRGASQEFLAHWDDHWANKRVQHFILIAACDLGDRRIQDAVLSESERFGKLGVTYAAWGADVLASKLRSHRSIAARYLPPDWVDDICGPMDAVPDIDRDAWRLPYLRWVLSTCRQPPMAVIDPAAARHGASATLASHFTDLDVEAPEEDWVYDAMVGSIGQGDRVPALTQVIAKARLVVLGEPGAGKSTLLDFLALCLAGEALGDPQANLARLATPLGRLDDEPVAPVHVWPHGLLLPIRLNLREVVARGLLPPPGQRAGLQHVWRAVASVVDTADLAADRVRDEVEARGGLFLIDGLDEIPAADDRRTQVVDALNDLAAAYPHCRIIVTVRPYAYQRLEWQLAGFNAVTLLPLSPEQQAIVIDRWYEGVAHERGWPPEERRRRAADLRAATRREPLRDLAARPLLLTLMASMHTLRDASLPEDRAQLYDEAVDLLLARWEEAREAPGTPVGMTRQPGLAALLAVEPARVRGLLEELAFRAHAGELGATEEIPGDHLIARLVALNQVARVNINDLRDYLRDRAGLLLEHDVNRFRFPHRTIQEYLAGCWLARDDFPGKLADLARADPDRWRDVTLLAGAQAARAESSRLWALVNALCPEAPPLLTGHDDTWGAFLAGGLLAERRVVTDGLRNHERLAYRRVVSWLVRILGDVTVASRDRWRAGDWLAALGDPRPAVMTLPGMQFCLVPAGSWRWRGEQQELRAYWIGRYPVSVAQFDAFVLTGGYGQEEWWTGLGDGQPQALEPANWAEQRRRPNRQVGGVSWAEAMAFARWLTAEERAAGRLPDGARFDLPSPAAWRMAAHGGAHRLPAAPVFRSLADGGPLQAAVPDGIADNPSPGDPYLSPLEDEILATLGAIGCSPNRRAPVGVEDGALTGGEEWTRRLVPHTDWVRYEDGPPGERRSTLSAARSPDRPDPGAITVTLREDLINGVGSLQLRSRALRLGFRLVITAGPGE